MVSPNLLYELRMILLEEYGLQLSDDEVQNYAEDLILLFQLTTKAIKRNYD